MFRFRGSRLNKWVDRYVGIPLIFCYWLWKKISRLAVKETKEKNILAIQIVSIGDAVLTLPALKYLTESGYAITVLTSDANDFVYKLAGYPTQVFRLGEIFKSPLQFYRKLKNLRRQNFAFIVDFLPWARLSAAISLYLKSPRTKTIGFRTKDHYRGYTYDLPVNHSDEIHESENFFELARKIKQTESNATKYAQTLNRETILKFVDAEMLNAKLAFDFQKENFIVVHPWSGGFRGRDKEWDLKNYLEIAKSLPADYSILVLGTHEDLNRAKLLSLNPKFKIFSGQTNLAGSILILTYAKAVLTVNTGVLHLASWLGKDVIALNGPAGEVRWGGLKTNEWQKILNVNATAPCSPCLNLGFEYKCKTMYCMPTISPKSVEEKLSELIASSERL